MTAEVVATVLTDGDVVADGDTLVVSGASRMTVVLVTATDLVEDSELERPR